MNPGNLVLQDQSFYTSWMERGGDYLVVQFEVLSKGPSGSSVTVTPYTKNDDETDGDEVEVTGASSSSLAVTLNTVGLATMQIATGGTQGILEQIRLKFAGTAGTVESGAYWIDYRIIGFVWYDNATAS